MTRLTRPCPDLSLVNHLRYCLWLNSVMKNPKTFARVLLKLRRPLTKVTKKCESEAKEGPRRNSQNFENNDKKRSIKIDPMFLFFAIKIYTADFTYRTLYTSNVAARMCYSVADQDLEIRGREGFWGGGGRGAVSKKLFAAFRSKKKWGPGPPGPLPWIRHCYYVHNKGRNIVTHSHKDLTKKHGICEFYSFR